MNTKAHFNKSGNIKLGAKMWSFSKLCGEKIYHVNGIGDVQGTCKGYCSGCEKSCYVNKSYRYGSVLKCHAINTVAFVTDIDKAFADLRMQIVRARKKPDIIRIDQSGEIQTVKEFRHWIQLAKEFSNIRFYVYTKAFDIVIPELINQHNAGTLPENFTVLISIWHECGASAFAKVCNIPNVKAFAYDDGYAYDFTMQTYCKAYDNKGKLNHDITCEKCRKCFDRSANHKIIGCKAH